MLKKHVTEKFSFDEHTCQTGKRNHAEEKKTNQAKEKVGSMDIMKKKDSDGVHCTDSWQKVSFGGAGS